jgi:quinol monooxygenase YgiN
VLRIVSAPNASFTRRNLIDTGEIMKTPNSQIQMELIVTLPVKPSYREQFRAELLDLGEKIRTEPDFLGASIHEEIGDPDTIVIRERWATSKEKFVTEQLSRPYRLPYEHSLGSMLRTERSIMFLESAFSEYHGKGVIGSGPSTEVIVVLPVAQEWTEQFRADHAALMKEIETEPDFVGATVHVDASEPNTIVLQEVWLGTKDVLIAEQLGRGYREAYEKSLQHRLRADRSIRFLSAPFMEYTLQ